jgi:hypothetical protein
MRTAAGLGAPPERPNPPMFRAPSLAWLAGDGAEPRRIGILLTLVAFAVFLRLATWNPVADGPWGRAARLSVLGGAGAIAVWALVRAQAGRHSRLPIVCAAATLLVSDTVHYFRLANPATRGGPVLAFEASFTDDATVRRQWEVETRGGGSARVEGGALVLDSPPGGVAYVVARLADWPSAHRNWLLPVGLLELPRIERVAWRATATRTQPFYVLFEARRLLVQLVEYGVHVTYPDERNAARGHELRHPAGSDGRPHDWLLTRDTREIALWIDGQVVWRAPQREELGQVRLGEPRADAQHGGRLRLDSARYAASLAVNGGS